MSSAGYSEIPGVYRQTPRPLARLCHALRTHRATVVVALVLMVVALASLVSVVLTTSSVGGDDGPQDSPTPDGMNTLLALTWPRRDESWYVRRWARHCTRSPDDPQRPHYPPDPLNPDDPDGPQWTAPDGSTFPKGDTWHWNRRPQQLPDWTSEDVSGSLAEGSARQAARAEVENSLAENNCTLRPDTAAYRHQHAFRKTDPLATNMSRLGYLMDTATAALRDRKNLSREAATFDVRWVGDLSDWPYCDSALQRPVPPACVRDTYRSFDGSCNNLDHPTWGAAFTRFSRALPPDYADGVWAPRVATDGTPLPGPRQVSNGVHGHKAATSLSYTMLTMAWGQLVDHDITLTALSKGKDGKSLSCCNMKEGRRHPECLPVSLPKDDPFYADFNQTCMEFVRSSPAPRCHFGPRQQLNQQTSFLDGSVLYGVSQGQAAKLRTFKDGLLRTQVSLDGRQLLPPTTDLNDGCNQADKAKYNLYCFLAGDPRANEQTLLTVLHTVLARQHNTVAIYLKELNPSWNDERLFQETRRIVVAQIQHITYHEYIPSVLGPVVMKELGLSPQDGGTHTHQYRPDLHPGIANGFAAAAYRFGHSQIQGLVQKIDSSHRNVEFAQLSSIVFQPFTLYQPGTMADLVRGEVSQRAGAVDTFFTTQVTGKLFRGSRPTGLDLVAVNVQRGRDHGLPSYTRWRMSCGLPPATTFQDLRPYMDAGALVSLQKVYRTVEDVDLYSGGLAERPITDGLVGPTFACIIADQFLRLKQGDRFWYEAVNQPHSFTEDQLLQLHKTSLARLLCDNVPELGSIQRWPLRVYGPANPRLPCSSSSIPQPDMEAWDLSLPLSHTSQP